MILVNAVKVTFAVLVSLMMVAVPFTLTSESYASSDGSSGVAYEGKDFGMESFEKLTGWTGELYITNILGTYLSMPFGDEDDTVLTELDVDKLSMGMGWEVAGLENYMFYYLRMYGDFELRTVFSSDVPLMFADQVVEGVDDLATYLGVDKFSAGDVLEYEGDISILTIGEWNETYLDVDGEHAIMSSYGDMRVHSIVLDLEVSYLQNGSHDDKEFSIVMMADIGYHYDEAYTYASDILVDGPNTCTVGYFNDAFNNIGVELIFDDRSSTKTWIDPHPDPSISEGSETVFAVPMSEMGYDESQAIKLSDLVGPTLSDAERDKLVDRTGTVTYGYNAVYKKFQSIVHGEDGDDSLDRALLIGGSIIGVMAFGMLLYFMLRRDTA